MDALDQEGIYTIKDIYALPDRKRAELIDGKFIIWLRSIQNTKNYVAEPDISAICDKSRVTDRGCDGAPDWILEIVSPCSRK